MSGWVYDGHDMGDCSNREVARAMMDDPDNQEVQDEFWTWCNEFGDNYPDTTLLAFIIEHADGVCRVSDMLAELEGMFVDYLAENEDLMSYCGAEWRDLESEREEWNADNRGE